jgi:DNA polymerase-3 subunit gamma/tau
LNCLTDGPRPDPCGICEACTSIADGIAFDVVEIDAASNNGIDSIRELREKVNYAPTRLRTKLYIIDEVHMLSTPAFNALLKTLEEPPEHVVFVLATTEAHKVPVTIQSRCQRYEFRRVTPADIGKRLSDVAKIEKIKISPEALTRIAFLADGALRDALVLLDQARGFAMTGEIDGAVLDAAFGSSHRELIERIVDAVAASDAGEALRGVGDAVSVGADPAWLTKELLRWFRLALLALVGTELVENEVPPEEARSVSERAATLGKNRVLIALRELSEVVALRFSSQPRIDLELALARMILPSEDLSMRALSDRLRAVEQMTSGGTPPAASPSPSPAKPAAKKETKRASEPSTGQAAASVSTARLAGLWPMILSAARQRSMQAFGHLQHASVADASDELVTIWVDDKFNRDRLADAAMSALVADAIAQASGAHPQVRFVLSQSPAPKPASAGLALAADVLGDDLF